MKPAAAGCALLGGLCLALCLGGARGLPRSSGDSEWRKLIMVHHWPATVCKEVEDDCKDPPDYWTIHGLWADRAEQCNRSWPFHLEEIKDLLQDMRIYWPDVIHSPSNRSSFCMLQKLGILPSGNYYQVSDIKDALASLYGVVPKVQCLPPEQGEGVQTLGQIELCLTKDLQLRNCTEPGEPAGSWRGAGPARPTRSLEVCEDGPVFYPPPR
ncbi:ribonuclease T2 isoform X5 [Molossus molossus]|uniref:ribonuclease T2 isoform X5 n=1 Tax=Molossus molossus TaxID=27622 RepID=UPI001747179F|nr:ribonuclease T2 isoform X5 [Molossus molossus]